MGGDLPSFALLSSPSRECFLAMRSNTESSVRSDTKDSVAQDVRMVRVVDDGRWWTITSHPIIRGINLETCFNYQYMYQDGRSTRRASKAAHIREGKGTGSGMYDHLGKS